jgi:Peptidase propeptide and YPEB domain
MSKGDTKFVQKGMDMRTLLTTVGLALIACPALAQTQPTSPSAYATSATISSAYATSAISPCYSSTSPTSPCYSGTAYLSYSAISLSDLFPNRTNPQAALLGANSLNEDQAKSRIEVKGYSSVSELQKDDRGIWRGKATMKDGRSVAVTLDLEGNIFSRINP